jgi:UDP-N-acetylmuramate dehydrogenase
MFEGRGARRSGRAVAGRRQVTRAMTPQRHVPLAPMSTLGVGGRAAWFINARTSSDVAQAQEWCDEHRLPLFVMGGASNLVIADEGVPGLVLHMALSGRSQAVSGGDTLVHAGAGEPWDALVAEVVSHGLAGIECLSGIPGSVGGTPIQNVGAYGQEMRETIESVDTFDRERRTFATLTSAECRFSYRMSRFKREDADRFVVCGVTFRLRPAAGRVAYPDVQEHLSRAGIENPTVLDVRESVIAIRRRKGMVVDAGDPDSRSVGSFFMNPVVSATVRDDVGVRAAADPPSFQMPDGSVKIPAAWLIERAGFARGFVDGAVAISSKHPLALVNRGSATAADVLRLATSIKRRVMDLFGVALRPEPVFVGFDGNELVEYLTQP